MMGYVICDMTFVFFIYLYDLIIDYISLLSMILQLRKLILLRLAPGQT